MNGDAEAIMSFAGNAGMIVSRASGLLLWIVPAVFLNVQDKKRRILTKWKLNL